MNGDAVVKVVTAILERAAELIEQKNPTGKSLRQACEEMAAFAKRHQRKSVDEIRLP